MNEQDMLTWIKSGALSLPTPLLTNYKKLNLNEQELVLIIHMMSFFEKGNYFPTHNELSERMTIDCTSLLRKLIQKGFVEIIEGFLDDGIRFEKYSLDPLWTKLIQQFQVQNDAIEIKKAEQQETDLYTCFEQEFGRPLSPFECETLGMWLDDDHHSPVIIKAALREAVISGKLNFRYIDRILFEWKKNGIQTLEQAKNHGRKFRQHQNAPKPKEEKAKSQESVPFYNWLEQ